MPLNSHTVSDLPAVPLQGSDRFVGDVVFGTLGNVDVFSFTLQLVEIVVPDSVSVVVTEISIVKSVNSRQERFIKSADSVRRQEEHPIIVLYCLEKAGHETVSLEVMDLTVFHVDVGFV